MRILRTIHSINPTSGGTVEALKQTSLALQARGHTVNIACLDAPSSHFVQSFPLPCHAIGPGWLSYGYAPAFSQWLKANVGQYDIVTIEGLWQFHSVATWKACKKAQAPYLLYPHGMLDPWFQLKYPIKHYKKKLYWLLFESKVARDAHSVCFTTEAEQAQAHKTFLTDAYPQAVIPIGTSIPQKDFRSATEAFHMHINHRSGETILLYCGRIHVKKGIDLVLKAFKAIAAGHACMLSEVHFVIAGPIEDAAYHQTLQALAQYLRQTCSMRITFLNLLSGDLKWGAFYGSDAFILTSHQENFSMAVAEALGCGLPVLISNKVNSYPWVERYNAGSVCQNTLESVQRMLEDWLLWEAAVLKNFKQAAYQCYKAFFDIHATLDIFENHLHAACKQ